MIGAYIANTLYYLVLINTFKKGMYIVTMYMPFLYIT